MSDHLSQRELLLHVDGELSGMRARQVRKHLQSCWACRHQLEMLETDIGAIVDAQNRAFLPSLPRPAAAWRSFEELAASLPDSDSRPRQWFRGSGSAMRWTAACALLSAAIAAIWLAPPRFPDAANPSIAAPRIAKPPAAPVQVAPSEPRPAVPETEPTPRPARPAAPTPPAPDLDELEMEIQYSLHRIGADLSEPIEMRKQGGRIVIAASGVSPERKQQLAEMFGNKVEVRLELAAPAPTANGTPPTVQGVESRHEPDLQLAAFFGSPEAQERFARTVLAADAPVLSRLYALRNLAQQWPAAAEARLSDDARRKLYAIVDDHIQALRSGVPVLQQTLAPFLEHFCAESTARTAATPTAWRDTAALSLEAARTLDADVRALLTTSATPVAVARACPEMKSALSQIATPQP